MAAIETEIHKRMRRCLLNDQGKVTAYLDPDNSYFVAGTKPQVSGTAKSSDILTLRDPGKFAGVLPGQYVHNITRDTYSQVMDTSTDELTLLHLLETTGERWGQTTNEDSNLLIDGNADFNAMGVEVGMIVYNRTDESFAEIMAINDPTELLLSDGIMQNGHKYSILDRNFQTGDEYEVCTAVLNGDQGQVMVEVPRFYVKHSFDSDEHSWQVSSRPAVGYHLHPAFRPGGLDIDAFYIGAFEGAISGNGQGSNILTSYNLGSDRLQSVAGLQAVVNGQRSEFRAVSANRGAGWQQEDFWIRGALQILFMVEYGDLNSQDVLGDGFTDWSSGTRDDHVVASNTNVIGLTGWSLRHGNKNADLSGGNAHVGSYMSYRGIENFWGHIWKWMDGVNYNNGRVYLSNNPADYEDDQQGHPYEDTGLNQPDSNGYVSGLHDYPDGFIVSANSGSGDTYMSDYYWYNSGWRVALVGGTLNSGGRAGFAALFADSSSATRSAATGARVCFRKH